MLGGDLVAVVFGLASALSWGAGDFSGGLATKRAPVFGVLAIGHAAERVGSHAQDVLSQSAAQQKYTFLLFFKEDNPATRTMAQTLKSGVARRADRAALADTRCHVRKCVHRARGRNPRLHPLRRRSAAGAASGGARAAFGPVADHQPGAGDPGA